MLQQQFRLPMMMTRQMNLCFRLLSRRTANRLQLFPIRISVVFFNFRPDRAREITRAFCDDDFKGFERAKRLDTTFVCFTEYDDTIQNKLVAFHKVLLHNTFGEYLAAHDMTQARIAETEKYAHVTFFFNGGVEEPNKRRGQNPG